MRRSSPPARRRLLAGIADRLVSSVPGARKIEVPSVAHMVNLEAPQGFDKALDEFLATHPLPQAEAADGSE